MADAQSTTKTSLLSILRMGIGVPAGVLAVLAMVVLPWVIFTLCRQVLADPDPRIETRGTRRWGIGFAGVLVVFMVARNVPVTPLCRLAPGGACAVVGHPG